MPLYFRVTNPDSFIVEKAGYSETDQIDQSEFTSTVGDRPPDRSANLADLTNEDPTARQSRRWLSSYRAFPPGAVVLWWLNEETGLAEGWLVPGNPPKSGAGPAAA